jgi:hypothetical protein
MYEPMGCSKCDTLGFYPDEVVVGFWVHDDGRLDRDNEFLVLDWEDHGGVLPEGAKVFCLDCAPCECGDHERLTAHTAENITRQERKVEMAFWHGC